MQELKSVGILYICFRDNCSKLVVPRKYNVYNENLLHSLGLVYKSMRGMMTNSIDRDQWLNVTSKSRDKI
jgi:hypothetical protein